MEKDGNGASTRSRPALLILPSYPLKNGPRGAAGFLDKAHRGLPPPGRLSDEEVALEAGLDTFFVSLTFEDYELGRLADGASRDESSSAARAFCPEDAHSQGSRRWSFGVISCGATTRATC